MPVFNLTSAEYAELKLKALNKFKALTNKTVTEEIYKMKPSDAQDKLDKVWACLYVINQYDPEADDNYLEEEKILKISNILHNI